jgi:large subunit ribosomal protein L30
MAKLQITLKHSTIGRPPDQRATVRSLGLRRLHQTVEREDDAVTLGMLRAVAHLIEVRPADETNS